MLAMISDDAKKVMLGAINTFPFSEDDRATALEMRRDFVSRWTKERIANLRPEEYFPGPEKSHECFGYELEWPLRILGSIKGGGMSKYGPKEKFVEIRELLVDIVSLADEHSLFYQRNGALTNTSKTLIHKSLRVSSGGCTVVGKVLHMYCPNTFVPIFSDQQHYLSAIVVMYRDDARGPEAFFRNNYLLLQLKQELSADPSFLQVVPPDRLTNDFFHRFLVYAFPPPRDTK